MKNSRAVVHQESVVTPSDRDRVIASVKQMLQKEEREVDTNPKQALRSIAYLLDWGSQGGNEDLDGIAAHGLSRLVERCVDEYEREDGRRAFILENLGK